ncbi:hypothetical protein K1X76_08225 [bacterium]|nr:hypothetical protein [bacterium]
MAQGKDKWKKFVKASQKGKAVLHTVLNGLVGDLLATLHPPLSIGMSFREKGKDLSVDELSKKIKDKKHVIVFVHGLMADDTMWTSKKGFGTRIENDVDALCLYVRYNSGLHISDNGKALAALLKNFTDRFLENILSLTLIGHSMGGLVIRSAEYVAQNEKHTWLLKYKTCLLLAPPLAGSHWEQLGFSASFVLKKLWNIPTRIIGAVGDLRSGGIHDLRHGLLVEDDWKNHNQRHVFKHTKTQVPLVDGVNYHVLTGEIANKEDSAFKKFFGDGLVGIKSGKGESPFVEKDPLVGRATFKHFYKTSHMNMAFSAGVYQYVKRVVAMGSTLEI